jgi:hypothetical protein
VALKLRKEKFTEYWEDTWIVYWIFGAISIISGIIMLVCFLQNGITCFGNPEYYALKEILSLVGK